LNNNILTVVHFRLWKWYLCYRNIIVTIVRNVMFLIVILRCFLFI